MSYLQTNAPIPGTDGVTYEGTKCYACQKMGHYAGQCPAEPDIARGVNMLQLEDESPAEEEYVSEFTFLKNDSSKLSHIPPTWVLLDRCSTI